MSAEPTLPKEIVEAVKYLAAASYDAGKHGATASSSVTDASKELGFAIAKALGEKDAEIARLNAGYAERDGLHEANRAYAARNAELEGALSGVAVALKETGRFQKTAAMIESLLDHSEGKK